MITNLADALKVMIARYATIVTYYVRLTDIAKKSRMPVPKTGMLIYNAAVADYLRYSNEVWKLILAKKLRIEMVKIGPDGKAMKDPKRPGQVLTKTIGTERMPLRPPIFVAPGVPYPSANAPYPAPKPTVAGGIIAGEFSGSDVGFGWKEVGEVVIVVTIGVIAAPVLGPALAIFVVVAGVGAIAADSIITSFRGPSANVAENLDAYTKIYDRSFKAKVAAGMKTDQADKEAAAEARGALAESRKAPESQGIGIKGMLLGLVALGGGFLLLSKKGSPA